jgi:hypothetical protein
MPWIQYLLWIAPLIGAVAIVIGGLAVIFPKRASKHFGIELKHEGFPYVAAAGARDIFIGLTLLIVYNQGDVSLLAKIILCVAVVSVIDLVMTLRHGTRSQSFIHLGGTIGVLAYGGALLFLTR